MERAPALFPVASARRDPLPPIRSWPLGRGGASGLTVVRQVDMRLGCDASLRCSESTLERVQHILHDIGGFFDADRETDEAGVDADCAEALVVELVVAHHRGLLDEGFDAAEAGGERGEAEAIDDVARRLSAAFDDEADDA